MSQKSKYITPISLAIADIMEKVPAIGKFGQNTEQKFHFRKLDDILDFLHPLFAEVGVVMLPSVQKVERENWLNQRGNRTSSAVVTMTYSFHCSDGSSIAATVAGEAIDYGDKAVSKATSMALKAVLAQVFLIPTHEIEADEEGHTQESQPGAAAAKEDAPKKPETLDELIAIRDTLLKENKSVPSDILGKISVLKAELEEAGRTDNPVATPEKPEKPSRKPRAQKPEAGKEPVIDVTPEPQDKAPEEKPKEKESEPENPILEYVISQVTAPAYYGKKLKDLGPQNVSKMHVGWVLKHAEKIAGNEQYKVEASAITAAHEYYQKLAAGASSI